MKMGVDLHIGLVHQIHLTGLNCVLFFVGPTIYTHQDFIRKPFILTVFVRLCFLGISPVNTNHLYNNCTMLDQRRRRWADIVQMLYKCFVFAGPIACYWFTVWTIF